MMEKPMAFIVTMISWVYTYLQTHQVVHIKYIQLLYVNYISIKCFRKR